MVFDSVHSPFWKYSYCKENIISSSSQSKFLHTVLKNLSYELAENICLL